MKHLNLKSVLLGFIFLLGSSLSIAQFDDLYYNPETDYVAVRSNDRSFNEPQNTRYAERSSRPADNYDDAYASRIDDYDFHYSSRIRRFNRPMMGAGFGFYDPFFVDRFYYDPFYQPGVSIYVNTGWNAFSPWNRRPWGFNRRGFGWGAGWGSPWCPMPRRGFGNPYAFNGMGMGFVRPMGFGMSPWGMNPYGGWGNTMIINNFYGGSAGFAGSDPWVMDNDLSRFSRLENPERVARSVSYGPRTIGASRTTPNTSGRSRDGLTGDRDNYDRYPASRRQASDGRSQTGQRTENLDSRSASPSQGVEGRSATGRSTEAGRTPQQNVRTQPSQTRRSLFNSSRQNSNNQRTSPQSNRTNRSSGVNRSTRSSRSSSGINRSSRSSNRSSGINRSSRSSSRSSGINRSSRSSSRSSGINRSSRSSSRSSGINRSSRSSSRSSGINRSSRSSSRSSGVRSSSRSSRGRG